MSRGKPEEMGQHLFWGAVRMHYETAVPATAENQDYSIYPRAWYIDADFECDACDEEFRWTASEQRVWFEEYRFWIDSVPNHCKACGAKRRHLRSWKQEYDEKVASARNKGSLEEKERVVELVVRLEKELGKLPQKMIETKNLFQRQIAKLK